MNNIDEKFNLFVYKSNDDILEYIITNLKNDNVYKFYIFSKNTYGISKPSNYVSLIPNKNKLLKQENIKNSYSNSLQNYYLQNESANIVDYKKDMHNYKRLIDVNNLKDILVDNLLNTYKNINNIHVF